MSKVEEERLNDEIEAVTVGPPEDPTGFAPGTIEKLRILRDRYASGLFLWDEFDATENEGRGKLLRELNDYSPRPSRRLRSEPYWKRDTDIEDDDAEDWQEE